MTTTNSVASTPRVTVDKAVEHIIEKTGGQVRLGLPLGLGKPNQLVNALYQRVKRDPGCSLTIYTALSLGRPRAGSDLEARFLKPFADRVFADYVELDYLVAVRSKSLPPNISVHEFFFQPGSMLGNPLAQQGYISCNYTHAARDLGARNLNVIAQLVAPPEHDPGKVSLSCNPEVTLALLPLLQAQRDAGETVLIVGQLHRELPYMPNDAEVDDSLFDLLVEEPGIDTRLFSTPNMPVTLQDHLVGLHASTLIADGGMLQIGIGALGDSLVHHILMRHHDNALYRKLVADAGALNFAGSIEDIGGLDSFEQGIYGCSEMITAGLLGLMDGGVIRRPVLNDADLQSLLERGRLGEQVSLHTLDVLMEEGVLARSLSARMLDWLSRQGILRQPVTLRDQRLVLPDGSSVVNDLEDRAAREALRPLLADSLRSTLLHGGFFLGPRAFYRRLREMSREERARINMTNIRFINELYGDERLKRLQRRGARFVNTVFSATLMGAGISDQLESGQVLSGVGGQYNFVVQGHELDNARSILLLRAWRERAGEASSNLVWQYGHTTIPRHLRDIYVTEYGIADLRGKSDAECIAAMLNICDSRFQPELLKTAQQAGKLSQGYSIPERHRYNLPERLEEIRQQHADVLPMFPLGSDFDRVEEALLRALTWLKEKMSSKAYLQLGRHALKEDARQVEQFAPHLARMALGRAESLKEKLYRRLLLAALAETA